MLSQFISPRDIQQKTPNSKLNTYSTKLCSNSGGFDIRFGCVGFDVAFCRGGGGFAMLHEFVIPVPTNALFDPVDIMGNYH
jgi:hypothetical protein